MTNSPLLQTRTHSLYNKPQMCALFIPSHFFFVRSLFGVWSCQSNIINGDLQAGKKGLAVCVCVLLINMASSSSSLSLLQLQLQARLDRVSAARPLFLIIFTSLRAPIRMCVVCVLHYYSTHCLCNGWRVPRKGTRRRLLN